MDKVKDIDDINEEITVTMRVKRWRCHCHFELIDGICKAHGNAKKDEVVDAFENGQALVYAVGSELHKHEDWSVKRLGDKPEIKRHIGQRYRLLSLDKIYILCESGYKKVCLIDICTGHRFCDSIEVKDSSNISKEKWRLIGGDDRFELITELEIKAPPLTTQEHFIADFTKSLKGVNDRIEKESQASQRLNDVVINISSYVGKLHKRIGGLQDNVAFFEELVNSLEKYMEPGESMLRQHIIEIMALEDMPVKESVKIWKKVLDINDKVDKLDTRITQEEGFGRDAAHGYHELSKKVKELEKWIDKINNSLPNLSNGLSVAMRELDGKTGKRFVKIEGYIDAISTNLRLLTDCSSKENAEQKRGIERLCCVIGESDVKYDKLENRVIKLENEKIGWNDKIPDKPISEVERMAPEFRQLLECEDCDTDKTVSEHSFSDGGSMILCDVCYSKRAHLDNLLKEQNETKTDDNEAPNK